MDKPRVIGLCGDTGSGKDTVADYLAGHHHYIKVAFASKLKYTTLDVFVPLGLEHHHVFGTQAQKNEPLPGIVDAAGVPRTGRSILEWLGTEGFRSIDPDVWIKFIMIGLVDQRPDARFVFSDARFPNEFAAIRKRGGVVWEVTKVGGPDHGGRTGHSSDEAWREEPKDGHLVARFGDLQALEDSTELLLNQAAQV